MMKKQMKRTVYEAPVTERFQVELEGGFMAGSIINGKHGVETTGHEVNEINAETYVFDTENNKTWNDTDWN